MEKLEWITREDGQPDLSEVLQARTAGTSVGIALAVQYQIRGCTGPSVEQFVIEPNLARQIGKGLMDAADELEQFLKSRN